MEQEPQGVPQNDAENPQEQQGEDPIAAIGQALQSLVDGVAQSAAPEEAKKAFAASLEAFTQGVNMMGGGGAQGPQPAAGQGEMAGANPNAQMVG